MALPLRGAPHGKDVTHTRVLDYLSEEEYVTAYIDLWPTETPAEFTSALAKALADATSTRADKLLSTAQDLLSHLRPSVTVAESGAPVLTFGATPLSGSALEIEEVLAAPPKIARKNGRRVVVVLDEFQQIDEYDEGQVERKLRSAIQHHDDVAYLFLGSRKHSIQAMFLDSKRPLYRSAEHYPLGPIEEDDWRPFIQERFETAGKAMPVEQVASVYDLTGGHPFCVQHLCHVLWERCEEGGTVSEEEIEKAVVVLLGRESYAYTALWESLTQNQRRFLCGLASEPKDTQPFPSRFVYRHGLGSPSSAQRAAEALIGRDLIDREDGFLRDNRSLLSSLDSPDVMGWRVLGSRDST